MTHQQQALLDHWNSFFKTLSKALNNPAILPPPTGTGIYRIWQMLYLEGKQLGPATSYEYDSTNWESTAIRCQDFGSCRIEYYSGGTWYAWGPIGVIAHG